MCVFFIYSGQSGGGPHEVLRQPPGQDPRAGGGAKVQPTVMTPSEE